MHLQIEMQDLLKDMKEYTDLMEYLAFVFEHLNEHLPYYKENSVDRAYREKFNKEPPEVG